MQAHAAAMAALQAHFSPRTTHRSSSKVVQGSGRVGGAPGAHKADTGTTAAAGVTPASYAPAASLQRLAMGGNLHQQGATGLHFSTPACAGAMDSMGSLGSRHMFQARLPAPLNVCALCRVDCLPTAIHWRYFFTNKTSMPCYSRSVVCLIMMIIKFLSFFGKQEERELQLKRCFQNQGK